MDAEVIGGRPRWPAWLAALGVGLLALGPALGHLRTRFLGIGAVDHPGTLWFYGQVLRALRGEPGALLTNDRLYAPWGQDLLRNTGANFLDGLLAAPFAVFGPVAGHNLFLVAVLVANGCAAAWATEGRGAWPVGLSFALAPYPLYELVEGRPAQALLVFFVVTVFGFGRALEGRWAPWRAAVALALLGLQYWFYAVFASLMLAAWTAVLVSRDRRGAPLVVLLRVLGGAAVLVAPLAVPLATALARGEVAGLFSGESDLLLHSFQPLLGVVTAQQGEDLVGTQRAVPVALLLAGAGAWWTSRGSSTGTGDATSPPGGFGAGGRASQLAMLVVLLVLSVGPWLWVNGARVTEPAYQALLVLLPPLQRLWHPSRAIAGLAVLGIGWLSSCGPRWRWAICMLGSLESARDGLLPLPTWDAAVPAGYECLAGRQGAVVELPFAGSQRHLWYQVVHGLPILGGFHEGAPEFQPAEARALRRDDPFLAALLAVSRGAPVPAAPGDFAALRDLGFRYVVLQLDELPPTDSMAGRAQRRAVTEGLGALLGPPSWQDARTRIWVPGDTRPLCPGAPPDREPGEKAGDRWVQDLGHWQESAPR